MRGRNKFIFEIFLRRINGANEIMGLFKMLSNYLYRGERQLRGAILTEGQKKKKQRVNNREYTNIKGFPMFPFRAYGTLFAISFATQLTYPI